MTKNRAVLELILAGSFWGFGFIAVIWSLRVFTPAESLFYRFLIAFVFGELIFLIFKKFQLSFDREEFTRALPAGALLAGMLIMQTIGLKYTTATKSGFLTSLYVIIVPLFNSWFFHSKSRWINYLFAFIAMIGTFILMGGHLEALNIGDLWTIGCAAFAALHIIYIGKNSDKIRSAFRFNNFQGFWCLLFISPLLFFQDSITFGTKDFLPWFGLFFLGIVSSVIAFYIQIRTQRVLSDTTASMLFLLESPFAALFGFLVLNEQLTALQISGALIILAASISQIIWSPAKKLTSQSI